MDTIVELVRNIPHTIWASFGGAAMALMGVLLSNFSTTRRLKIQLEHDARQKEKDRLLLMRREIYLKTMSELNEVHGRLVAIPQLDSVETATEGFKSFFSTVSQLGVVADAETASLASQFTAEYTLLVMRCLHSASSLIGIKAERKNFEELLEFNASKIIAFSEEASQLSRAGVVDEKVFGVLRNSIDFHQKKIKQFETLLSECGEKWDRLHKAYLSYVLKELYRISETHVAVFVRLRGDFGLSTDAAAVLEQFRENYRRMEAQTVSLA